MEAPRQDFQTGRGNLGAILEATDGKNKRRRLFGSSPGGWKSGHFGASWAALGALLGASGPLLGLSWASLGAVLGHLGALLAALEALLSHLGGHRSKKRAALISVPRSGPETSPLGPLLGPSWAILEPS